MQIPSYDDLTPSIPDIAPRDVLASAASLLPPAGPVAAAATGANPAVSGTALFAALHVTGGACDPAAIARDFSPRIERHPGSSIALDVADLQRLFGEPAAIAAQLAEAGAPRIAIATSYTAAILLARAAAGITVAAGDPQAALRDVPIAVLEQLLADAEPRPAGTRPVRRKTPSTHPTARRFDVLRRWGLTTLGEFAALPSGDLSARVGAHGLAVQRLARGIDPRPLMPDPDVPRFTGTFELEWPIDTLEPLSFVFARLLDPLSSALERADRGAVALHLTLRLTDRTEHVRSLQLPAPMRDPKVLRTLLLLDLESHPPAAAVDVVSIEIDPAPGRVVQFSLLQRAVPSPETLATLMARLGALVGDTRCGSPLLLDTHRPDAFAMTPPVFDEKGSMPSGGAHGAVRECPPFSLRRFRPPIAIRVAVEGGRPVRVAVDRRGMPGGVVLQAAGPWRTAGGWWNAERWSRDEWDVALGDGAVCRLVRDRDGGGWVLDAVVD